MDTLTCSARFDPFTKVTFCVLIIILRSDQISGHIWAKRTHHDLQPREEKEDLGVHAWRARSDSVQYVEDTASHSASSFGRISSAIALGRKDSAHSYSPAIHEDELSLRHEDCRYSWSNEEPSLCHKNFTRTLSCAAHEQTLLNMSVSGRSSAPTMQQKTPSNANSDAALSDNVLMEAQAGKLTVHGQAADIRTPQYMEPDEEYSMPQKMQEEEISGNLVSLINIILLRCASCFSESKGVDVYVRVYGSYTSQNVLRSKLWKDYTHLHVLGAF